MLEAGQTNLLLSAGSHFGEKPGLSGTLYFETTGVREFYERIKENVEIIGPLVSMDHSSLEFGIRDPDGHALAFSEQAQHPK